MFINLETPNFLHSSHQHTTHQQAAAAASIAHTEQAKPVFRNAVPKIRKREASVRAFWRKVKTDQNSQNVEGKLEKFGDLGIDTVI